MTQKKKTLRYLAKKNAQEEANILKKKNEKLKNEISQMKIEIKDMTDECESKNHLVQQDKNKIEDIKEENKLVEFEIKGE